jgi:hypothetical protein
MEKSSRKHVAIFIAPLVVAFIAASRIGDHVRTVDFLQIFASGTIVGVSLMGLIQTLKKKP